MAYVCVMDRDENATAWQQLPDCVDHYHPPNNMAGVIFASTFFGILLLCALTVVVLYWIHVRKDRLIARDKAAGATLVKQVRRLESTVAEHQRYLSAADYVDTEKRKSLI